MLSKDFQFVRDVTFNGIGTAGEDAKFVITFRSLPDDQLSAELTTMGVGAEPEAIAKQRDFNAAVIVSAKCPEHFPADEDARAWLIDASMGVRAAVRNVYVQAVYGGLAEKN